MPIARVWGWLSGREPWLVGAAWIGLLFAPLLGTERVLATRDAVNFHLPIRAALARLAEGGVLTWNPWWSGGQPLLSNPNYQAFYPTGWLAFWCSPERAWGRSPS